MCLVTDRTRLRPEDWGAGSAVDAVVIQIEIAAAAGVDLVQIRERGLSDSDLWHLVRRAVTLTAGGPTRIVVNDRLDVALAAGAAGVHLRADSILTADARSLAPADFLVGRSIHTVDEAAEAATEGAVDYLVCGTAFPTASKPLRETLGAVGLAVVCRTARPVPVLAIGGVDPSRIPAIAAAGAAGIAAIGVFATSGPTSFTVDLVRDLRFTFDRT